MPALATLHHEPFDSSPETLILLYNTMWGEHLDTREASQFDGIRVVTDVALFEQAQVVVFHVPTARTLPDTKMPGQLWVAWSMESAANYPRLRNRRFMSQFDLTMTYRLDSDVPVTYLGAYGGVTEFERKLRRSPEPKSPDRLATMFISSTVNKSGRFEYVTELMRYLDVHSYGKWMRNRSLPVPDERQATKLSVISQYKFDLSFENSISEDYVTEKFFDPLVAGTVPVYLGAPNIDLFAPGDRCFINTADFANPKELAEYLLFLNHDSEAYAEYFAWKQQPFRESFLTLVAEQQTTPFARLCALLRDRKRDSLKS